MNDIAVITLTNGGFALVDSEQFEELNAFAWSHNKGGYIFTHDEAHNTVLLHRVVNSTPAGYETHHINEVKHDCRTRNLETINSTNHRHTVGRQRNNTSGFKGVSWNTRNHRWVAQIKTPQGHIWLGYFLTAESAAAAYDEAAKGFFYHRAYINGVRNSPERCQRPHGEQHKSCKLTAETVLEIRSKLKSGRTQYSISKEYGLNPRHTWEIARGKIWKHLLPASASKSE